MAKYTLMKHQAEAVKFLDSVDGIGALLFDPGVGKTGSTLAWIDRLADKQGEVRVLVVSPLSAADTWVLQPPLFMDSPVKARFMQGSTLSILEKVSKAGAWTGVPDAKIKVDHHGERAKQVSGNRVTIMSLSAGALSNFCTDRVKIVHTLKALRKYAPHVIVVDESHIIKAHNSNLSKAMYAIGGLAKHRIILTGTVAPHSPLDAYGQWRFMAPWTFSDQYGEPFTKDPLNMTRAEAASVRPWRWEKFRNIYAELGGYTGNNIVGMNPLTVQDLHNRVAERSMVMTKEDALDLPPTRDVDVHVTLSPREAKAYEEMRKDLAAQMDDGSLLEAPNPLAKMMKLRQITAGFAVDSETGEVHSIGRSKQKTIVDLVNTKLAGEKRVVVFAYFRSECAELAKAMKAQGRTVEVVTGATKPRDRLAIRQRFGDVSGNPEQIVLIAQARTMSLSVNELVTASHAVFSSLSQQREDLVQGRGRLDRNGQTKPVTFWNVQAPGTIDEVILQNHLRKGDLERAMLDHIKAKR